MMTQPTSGALGEESHRGLHGQLIETLGQEIARGDLRPGDRLVPGDLVGRFDVSRTVVREALRVLESKGMTAARPKTGTRILTNLNWNVLDADVIRWRALGADAQLQFEELVDLRGAIEPLAARKAAADGFGDQAMSDALDDMAEAVRAQDWEAFTHADVTFHRELLAASGSLTLRRFSTPIEAAIRVRHSLDLVPERPTQQVIESHRALLDAMRGGDLLQAELSSRRIVDVAGAETIDVLLGRTGGAADGSPKSGSDS